jgi:hypothetical protein
MASTRALALAAALAPALLAGPAAFGQPAPADVSGSWDLQTSVFLGQVPVPEGLPDCEYQGSAQVTQDGSELGGTSNLTLVSGDGECPAEMSADIDGQVVGTELEMGMLMGGQLGTALWGGSVDPQLEGEGGTGGDFTVDSGPFTGAVGTWSAVRGEPSALVIPTLTTVGVIVLVALLLGAAALLLRRSGAATA